MEILAEIPQFDILHMVSAAEALHIILKSTNILGTEKASLLKSGGRILCRDVVAKENLPPFDNSSMDGFALASIVLKQASQEHPRVMRIVGESSAGNVLSRRIAAAQAVRVMTGGVIPRGADAVVPKEEATEIDEEGVQFTKPAHAGQYVRRVGEDIKRGAVVLKAGDSLTPPSMGVLGALGYHRVHVYRKPSVNIIATGDELVGLLEKPSRGQIRNSTSYGLAGYVLVAGGLPKLLGIAKDRGRTLRVKLKQGLDADVLLVTGGVSVGKYDLVKDTLLDLGVEIKFWKVNIKPGRPLVFGVRGKTLVFGLPGNPVSSYVTFLQFVRPALLKLAGGSGVQALRLSAVLDQDFSKSDGKRHFLRGIAVQQNGEFHVVTTGTQSSGAMSSMSKANCLIIITENTTVLQKGDKVEIELLPSATDRLAGGQK